MYKRAAATLLLSTIIAGSAAVAQTAAPMPGAGGAFVTDQGTNEFRASKFVGLDIYGTDNEKIGDINEVLIDAGGNAKTIVIGVGGFLGIGQKNVAVQWSAVSWSNDRPATTTGAGAGMNTAATGTATVTTGGTTAGSTPAGTAPAATTGSTGGAVPMTTPARSPAEQAAYNGYPDHGRVQLTKAQLQEAPAFKYYSDTHSSSGAASNATPPAGGTTARP